MVRGSAGLWIRSKSRGIGRHYEHIVDDQGGSGKVKRLTSILSICASCRKIRNKDGAWSKLENVVRNSDTDFSHGICPGCAVNLLPRILWGGRPSLCAMRQSLGTKWLSTLRKAKALHPLRRKHSSYQEATRFLTRLVCAGSIKFNKDDWAVGKLIGAMTALATASI